MLGCWLYLGVAASSITDGGDSQGLGHAERGVRYFSFEVGYEASGGVGAEVNGVVENYGWSTTGNLFDVDDVGIRCQRLPDLSPAFTKDEHRAAAEAAGQRV